MRPEPAGVGGVRPRVVMSGIDQIGFSLSTRVKGVSISEV